MKNFPHQYNDLRKLRATLETVSDLQAAGADSSDDGVLGYELAERRIYGFRRLEYEGDEPTVSAGIARRIAVEQQKPSGGQGARTAAREMRRTLRYLGWVDETGTSLAPPGLALLGTPEGSDAELVLLQQAIGSIAVSDRDGNISHPVLILLRLIDDIEFESRAGMQVALEARDDSAGEFRRIAGLARLPVAELLEVLKTVGWTEPQFANAVKILPSFAEQSGLVSVSGAGRYILTEAGGRALGRANVRTPAKQPSERRRSGATRRNTAITTSDPAEVGGSRRLVAAERRALSPEEQAAAAGLLYERTERHQQLVRAFASRSRTATFHEDAAAYDLVVDVDPADALILVEAKTISGDAAQQLRSAVGQLLYYEHFAVAQSFPGRSIRRVVAVDDIVPRELAEFLQALIIGLVIYKGAEFTGLNDLGESVAADLFPAV